MKQDRIFNFNAGPAALPTPVLEEIQESFLNLAESGMSITEISHRSKIFDDIINDAIARAKRLLKLDDKFKVLFIQGGASLQFVMAPMNFLSDNKTADYINTGTWATKAIAQAEFLKKDINIAASSADKNFSYIPKQFNLGKNSAYLHITSNNTIKGTQWDKFPDTGGVPLIADMSSDIMSRVINAEKFGLIYAGAQKNIGPAGVCLAIVREDMLSEIPDNLPPMLNYSVYSDKKSLYNTPPCFGIYVIGLVLKWLEETIGGLEKMEEINRKKANLLYNLLDSGEFYKGTAQKDSRSKMNVTFRLPNEELEQKFVAQAMENNLGGLKGHRSVGGCRASIYNAATIESVETLASFMKEFETKNG